ncbi:hypothetical protein [Cyprinid herpesvirus 2]|nr:hypothetical protein [Cyprinid herpesvirus 2]
MVGNVLDALRIRVEFGRAGRSHHLFAPGKNVWLGCRGGIGVSGQGFSHAASESGGSRDIAAESDAGSQVGLVLGTDRAGRLVRVLFHTAHHVPQLVGPKLETVRSQRSQIVVRLKRHSSVSGTPQCSKQNVQIFHTAAKLEHHAGIQHRARSSLDPHAQLVLEVLERVWVDVSDLELVLALQIHGLFAASVEAGLRDGTSHNHAPFDAVAEFGVKHLAGHTVGGRHSHLSHILQGLLETRLVAAHQLHRLPAVRWTSGATQTLDLSVARLAPALAALWVRGHLAVG